MMGPNKLVIAAAGSGKTTYLVRQALAVEKKRVLITTTRNRTKRRSGANFSKSMAQFRATCISRPGLVC